MQDNDQGWYGNHKTNPTVFRYCLAGQEEADQHSNYRD